uniref:FAST kinase domains 2 n=1 Tax=Bubo bubo TaxID=30461 RepID=A0A8C0ET14_BUBBB
MNNKISYLLNTVRCIHRCNSVLIPKSSATTRKHILWIGRYRDPLENVSFRKLFLNIFPSLHGSSRRFLSQKTDVFSTDAKIEPEKGVEALVSEQAPQSSLELEKLDDSGSSKVTPVMDHSEPFFNSLRKCTCPCDALDLASESAVSIKHFTNCLTTVWRLFKNLSEDQQRYEKQLIFEHPMFAKLCQQLLRDSRRMSRGDLVFSLHAVVNLGVPQNTLLVQTLVRVCQEKLNLLDNRCLSVLATTLAGLDKDKNVSALQAGLQLLVEQRIPSIRDIFILQNLMKCVGKDAPVFLKKKLEMAVLKEIDHLTSLNALRVVLALVAMNYCSIPILNACSKKIQENVHDAPFWQLILVLEACYSLRYRNVKLFSALADYVNSTVCLWDKRQIILFLSAFETLGFQPSELMGIFAKKVTEDPEFLNLKNLLIVLRVYSRLNYVPRDQKHLFFETLHSCLNKYLPQIPNTELLKAVYSLCVLGYLPHRAIDELLQKDSRDELLLSGQALLCHVIVLKGIVFFPTLLACRLAFLFVPLSAFCVGTMQPQGKLAVKKRHLNKLGYHVILVLKKKFQEMTNEDAVKFLKGKIYSENVFCFSEVTAQDNN